MQNEQVKVLGLIFCMDGAMHKCLAVIKPGSVNLIHEKYIDVSGIKLYEDVSRILEMLCYSSAYGVAISNQALASGLSCVTEVSTDCEVVRLKSNPMKCYYWSLFADGSVTFVAEGAFSEEEMAEVRKHAEDISEAFSMELVEGV